MSCYVAPNLIQKGKNMYYFILLFICFNLMFFSCTAEKPNPFFSEWDTPFQTTPFNEIKVEHYKPAMLEGMEQQRAEIDAIVNNPEPPSFENTIEAMETSGELLTKTSNVFSNMKSANTNDQMDNIAEELAPLLAKHGDDIILNDLLFRRVKSVYKQKVDLNLNTEQDKLLEEYYQDFIRGGANLNEADKNELREINKELSVLTLKFGKNVLDETNIFELVIDDKEDLAGLPENVIITAAETAKERGYEGSWVFTIHKPSLIPFLQYSDKRELREKMFKAYINQGNNNNERDNKEILSKIAALRVKRAQLLGYKTHADFVLEKNMAKIPENVYSRLDQLWKPALRNAKKEAKELQNIIYKDGKDFKLKPWDWWYYTEELKKEKFDLDDEVLRPYFKLENVQGGAFSLANKLFGITFEQRDDVDTYHPDVTAYEVKEADGGHIGILYVDYFPRASKRSGAWMSSYRKQSKIQGDIKTPIVTNVFNFSKPTSDKPSLLTFEEVETIFHEFGHALHGLLSNRTYPKLTGTDVAWDFVELPSQIMENWASEPEVLKMYAKHYETGEILPDELINKIKESRKFNQGFKTVEYLAAAFLDMDWHTITQAKEFDAIELEDKSMAAIGLIPEIVVRYRSPYFRHIFSGDYSAGYYVYIWAEMLDADAFEAFKETNLFNQELAKSFRENILAPGGTEDPMTLYKRFRGREPMIEPLLKKRGLVN
jgi:peptidyl-dipeptidase Dcp